MQLEDSKTKSSEEMWTAAKQRMLNIEKTKIRCMLVVGPQLHNFLGVGPQGYCGQGIFSAFGLLRVPVCMGQLELTIRCWDRITLPRRSGTEIPMPIWKLPAQCFIIIGVLMICVSMDTIETDFEDCELDEIPT